jgi:RimK family alpha-L-glutamate ligase
MKSISLITGYKNLVSNQSLHKAAQKLNVKLIDFHPASKSLPLCDGVLMRLGVSFHEVGVKMAERLEELKIPVINSASSIKISKNKWSTYQKLQESKLPQLDTELISYKEDLYAPLEDYPKVLKTLYGSKGIGVHLCHSPEEALLNAAPYFSSGYKVLLQNYLENPRELRAFFVGDDFIFIEKEKAPGDFRANWHLGGGQKEIKASTQLESLSRDCAKVLGLSYGAIDFLETAEGLYILEANDSTGLEGIENLTGKDLASGILRLLI